MGTKEVPICRLCLRECYSGFNIIEETAQSMLNFILLILDLGISDEPVMCNRCAIDLEKYFKFKTGCLDKNSLLDNIPNAAQFSPSNIQPDENVKHAAGTSNISDVCCLCMRQAKQVDMFLGNEEDVIPILEAYFPEMGSNVTEDSRICCTCCKFLENYLAFINNCLLIETRIKEYCKCEGTNGKGQVELNDVIYFVPKSMMSIDIDSGLKRVKLEENYELEDCEITLKDESEVLIKEEIDMFNYSENVSDYIEIEHSYCKRLESITPTCDSERCRYEANTNDDPKNMSSHEKTYKCTDCPYKSSLKQDLRRHRFYEGQPTGVLYECKNCDYNTKFKRCIKKHEYAHEIDNISSYTSRCRCSWCEVRKIYHCPKCTYITECLPNLFKHTEIHKNDLLACKKCSFTTKYKCRLVTHLMKHMWVPESQMYKGTIRTYQVRRSKPSATSSDSQEHSEK